MITKEDVKFIRWGLVVTAVYLLMFWWAFIYTVGYLVEYVRG